MIDENEGVNPVSHPRLNAEPPNDPLSVGLDHLKSPLAQGIPCGQMVVFCSKPHRDLMLNWVKCVRRISAEGNPVRLPLEDLPSTKYEVLKGRPADKAERFAVDYAVQLTPLDWTPGDFRQAECRARRRVSLNALRLPKNTASRNQREGVYGFKVDGRHTRRKRLPKVEILTLDSATISKIRGLVDANVDQKQRTDQDSVV